MLLYYLIVIDQDQIEPLQLSKEVYRLPKGVVTRLTVSQTPQTPSSRANHRSTVRNRVIYRGLYTSPIKTLEAVRIGYTTTVADLLELGRIIDSLVFRVAALELKAASLKGRISSAEKEYKLVYILQVQEAVDIVEMFEERDNKIKKLSRLLAELQKQVK